MSDTSSVLDSLGGGLSDIFSGVGNAFSGATNWIGNQLGFSGTSSTPSDTGGSSGISGYTPTPSGNYNASGQTVGPVNFQNSLAAIPGSTGTPTSPMSALSVPSISTNDFDYTSASSNPSGAVGASTQSGSAPPKTQSILDDLLGTKGASSFNPLGAIASTGALAYNLLSGSPTNSAEKQIKNLAAGQSTQGQQLENYLASGTLPPGAQQWVSNQTAAQTAAIKSKYAQFGLSGSTAETQELNNVQEQATAQMYQIASSLLQTGITETNASAQLYSVLMQAQNADANEVSSAIQNFVASLAGSSAPGTVNLKLAS